MKVTLSDGTTKRFLVDGASSITFKADKNDSRTDLGCGVGGFFNEVGFFYFNSFFPSLNAFPTFSPRTR